MVSRMLQALSYLILIKIRVGWVIKKIYNSILINFLSNRSTLMLLLNQGAVAWNVGDWVAFLVDFCHTHF